MRSCRLQRNDMHALPHTENIALVHGIPETRCMAQMGLRRHEQFESHIFGFWGRDEHVVGFVVWLDTPADVGRCLFDVLRELVVAGDLALRA